MNWELSSDLDERWNCEGETNFILSRDILPEDIREKREELKDKYGEIPEDLILTFYRKIKNEGGIEKKIYDRVLGTLEFKKGS